MLPCSIAPTATPDGWPKPTHTKWMSSSVKNASRDELAPRSVASIGVMSIESGLLISAVVAIAIYLLVALIFPERF